jgi:hypothetical protein
MTRETKAGLVVSCSFLCLVGIVLVSKLKEANTPAPDHDALAVAPADPQKVDEPAPTSSQTTTGGTAGPTAGQQAEKQQQTRSGVIPARFPASDDAKALLHGNSGNSSTAPATQKSLAPSPSSQDAAGPVMDDTPAATDLQKEKQNPPAPVVTPAQTKSPGATPPQPKKSSILTWIPDLLKKKATTLPGMGLNHGAKPEPPAAQGLAQNSKDGKLDAANGKNAAASNNTKAPIPLPPVPPLEPKADSMQSKPIVAGITSATAAPSVGSLNADSGSRAPTTLEQGLAGGNNSAGSPGSPSTGENSGPGQGARLNAPAIAPAEQAARNNANNGAIPSRNDETAGQSRVPLGNPLPAASLPSSIPSPAADLSSSGGTQVESYDEDTYVCKATDTFASISQAVYRTEIYGQALLLFNRNHPLATENVRRDPPVIQAGQPIYIPPMEILRKYYASAIAETAASTSRPSPAASLTDAAASIRPLAVAPSATVAAPAPASAPERSYHVSGNGEMLRDIARRTLGNGDRWAEIYRLNPKYDPVYPVPAGADLRLPGNARVDAQGTP